MDFLLRKRCIYTTYFHILVEVLRVAYESTDLRFIFARNELQKSSLCLQASVLGPWSLPEWPSLVPLQSRDENDFSSFGCRNIPTWLLVKLTIDTATSLTKSADRSGNTHFSHQPMTSLLYPPVPGFCSSFCCHGSCYPLSLPVTFFVGPLWHSYNEKH